MGARASRYRVPLDPPGPSPSPPFPSPPQHTVLTHNSMRCLFYTPEPFASIWNLGTLSLKMHRHTSFGKVGSRNPLSGHKLTLCAAGPTRSQESGILDGYDQGSGLGIMPWEVTGGRVTWKSGALTHPRECWEFPGATRVRLGCEPLPKQGRPQTRPAFAASDILKGG